jgi:exoribonuclease R
MSLCKINIQDRNYTSWDIVDAKSLKPIELKICPIKLKLFNQDIFSQGQVIDSPTRSMKYIPGVLVLEGNRMYGKVKRNRYYYRVVPDDRCLPEFLMAYSPKIGFEKKQKNKYVLFRFKEWYEKHPICTNIQTIGDIGILENFYEYQLYCKGLYVSIKDFTKKTKLKPEEILINEIKEKYEVEDRTGWEVISIDPLNSKDFDDAFGMVDKGDTILLSIYISNVSFWMDILDLWDSFTNRIATIYLPDKKHPMLPIILSDSLCSLQENKIRFAFTMDLLIDKNNYEILETKFINTCIKVTKNLRYDTEEQENYPLYKKMFRFIKGMSKRYKYVDQLDSSHDIVAYTMILMNYMVAKEFMKHKTGIFRTAKLGDFKEQENVPDNIKKFLKMWSSKGGKYVKYEEVSGHDMLGLEAYVHITSPIRRLVDLLNIIELQNILGLCSLGMPFYKRWVEKIEYINITMRSIRKVQNDCALLNLCVNEGITNREHEGFIIDKIQKDDLYKYMVYFPEIKMVNRFSSRYEKENLSKHKFRLFIFLDEIKLREKIRIELVD